MCDTHIFSRVLYISRTNFPNQEEFVTRHTTTSVLTDKKTTKQQQQEYANINNLRDCLTTRLDWRLFRVSKAESASHATWVSWGNVIVFGCVQLCWLELFALLLYSRHRRSPVTFLISAALTPFNCAVFTICKCNILAIFLCFALWSYTISFSLSRSPDGCDLLGICDLRHDSIHLCKFEN